MCLINSIANDKIWIIWMVVQPAALELVPTGKL
jgi:hypothetical protein